MPLTGRSLKAREFLFYTEDLAFAEIPEDRRPPGRRVMWTILQLNFGNPNIHFELQPQPSRNLVELGLHFEADVETDDAWASALSQRAGDVAAVLGSGWELEAWTASWRRLHRVFHFDRLTADLGRDAAAELAGLVTFLGPFVAAGTPDPRLILVPGDRPLPVTAGRAAVQPPLVSRPTSRT